MTLRVGEVADHQLGPRGLFGIHLALPAKALGLLERGLYVGHSDVEDRVPVVPPASPDPPGIPIPSLVVLRFTNP